MNTKNFKKHFKKGITPLLCALTIFNFCSINAFALGDYTASFSFLEPSYDSLNQGYLVLALRNRIYGDVVYDCFAWNNISFTLSPRLKTEGVVEGNPPQSSGATDYFVDFFTPNTDTFNQVGITLNDGNVIFRFYGSNETTFTNYVMLSQFEQGNNKISRRLYESYSDYYYEYTLDYTQFNFDVIGFYYKGNVYRITSNLSNAVGINVTFGMEYLHLVMAYDEIRNLVSRINITNNSLASIEQKLDMIFSQSSSGSIQDVSSSGISNVSNKEQELFDKNDSVSSDINNLQVDINPNAASVTWNLVNTAVMSNTKVFTMFLSILTIAIIGLILNR